MLLATAARTSARRWSMSSSSPSSALSAILSKVSRVSASSSKRSRSRRRRFRSGASSTRAASNSSRAETSNPDNLANDVSNGPFSRGMRFSFAKADSQASQASTGMVVTGLLNSGAAPGSRSAADGKPASSSPPKNASNPVPSEPNKRPAAASVSRSGNSFGSITGRKSTTSLSRSNRKLPP